MRSWSFIVWSYGSCPSIVKSVLHWAVGQSAYVLPEAHDWAARLGQRLQSKGLVGTKAVKESEVRASLRLPLAYHDSRALQLDI